MQHTKVTKSIGFAYHDSGAPSTKGDYITIVVIHGHTFHNGTFTPMLAAANSLGYRIILPNRRLYPGSTPYTKEEADALDATHATEDITKAFLKQGEYLLCFVNNMIKEHDLEKVILVGWSLGTAFLNTMVSAITAVEEGVKAALCQKVKSIVWWDPPATAHGVPDAPSGGWIPLYDETLIPEQRTQAFGQWLAHYYPHPNIDKKDCFTLIYKLSTPTKSPTFAGLSFEELLTKIDLTAGLKGDNHVADKHFQPVTKIVRDLAMFNPEVRSAWGNVPFNIIYGEESLYNVLWCAWQLEAESQKTGLPLKFRSMPGANHFAMHDHTKLSFDTLHACL